MGAGSYYDQAEQAAENYEGEPDDGTGIRLTYCGEGCYQVETNRPDNMGGALLGITVAADGALHVFHWPDGDEAVTLLDERGQ